MTLNCDLGLESVLPSHRFYTLSQYEKYFGEV